MTKNNYSIAKDISFRDLIDNSSNERNLEKILLNDYKYLFEELTNEKHSITEITCNIFKEISYNQHVVGFAAYTKKHSHIVLNYVYILPQYRGNRLFLKEITEIYNNGFVLKILEPNKKIIETLISYEFAEKIDKNLVLSAIELLITSLKTLSTSSTQHSNEYLSTNLYDLDNETLLSIKIVTYDNYNISYSKTSKLSSEFTAIKLKEYFDNIIYLLLRKDLEIERRLLLLKNNLPSKELNIKRIFSPQEIDPIYNKYLENGNITTKDLKEIKQQLFIDFTRSNIRKNSIEQRLNYLVNNFHLKPEIDYDIINPCPYCANELDYSERYCVSCGYDIFNDLNTKNRTKFLFEEVLKEQQSYKYSLNGKKEKIKTSDEEYRIILAIQNIIQNLNINTYKTIFSEISDVYSISNQDLQQLMLEKQLISYDVDEYNWFMEAHEYTLTELKQILREYNLKQSGNKTELINRISSSISLKNIKSKIPKITESAHEYYEKTKLIRFHNKYLKKYVYKEYENFCDNNEGSLNEITIKFLEKHVDEGFKTRNHNQIVESLRNQFKLYSNNKDIEEMIRLELKIFVININMLFIDEEYYQYYEPVSNDTFKNLRQFMYEYDYQEMVFLLRLIYDQINEHELKLSLEEVSDILNELLRESNLNNFNNRIKYNHYHTEIKINKKENKKIRTKITSLDMFY